ncbi:glycosyltransferase family 2 protein [Tenacibaculum sp. TC6]|uniref:glycosyltransferase family 2 protein n=1 Tax=Tenacibaculum sp. TC6 TaxID=3423223 RepID=UPI003D364CF3
MISVVVPVYNVEKYVERCINSIVNQTFKDIEIIIVNDGSTDTSLEICKKIEKEDSRITIITQENKGLSGARNTGIKAAQFPYITFIDSDDWIEAEYIEILYNSLIKYDADIAVVEYDIVFEEKGNKNQIKSRNNNGRVEVFSVSEAIFELITDRKIKNYAWGKMYKTALFKEISYPEGLFYEDVFTTYKLFFKSKKIVKTNKILAHYLQRTDNITSKVNNSIQKEKDYYESFFDQFNNILNSQYKYNNQKKIKREILRKFYRLKKRVIKQHNRSEFLQEEEKINQNIKKFLKELTLFDMGLILYFKCKIILFL